MMSDSIVVRFAVSAAFQIRRLIWFVSRPTTFGVQAVAITAAGKVVLVRLTYRNGWHLPGGARPRQEPEHEAIIRELREEIGLQTWKGYEVIGRTAGQLDWKNDSGAIFLFRDVTYAPRRFFEVAEVGEFAPDQLPDISSDAAAWIAIAASSLSTDDYRSGGKRA